MISVRVLAPDEAEIWRDIRLEGLQRHPEAFLTQYEDTVAQPLEHFAQQLEPGETYAAFDGERVIGCMGAFKDDRKAVRHRAMIAAVYVRTDYQGQGVADALLTRIIEDLPPRILQLHLEVNASNHRAVAFYKRHGFQITGTTPRATLVDGVARDDHSMVRMLDA